jgi:hypothetical protein
MICEITDEAIASNEARKAEYRRLRSLGYSVEETCLTLARKADDRLAEQSDSGSWPPSGTH